MQISSKTYIYIPYLFSSESLNSQLNDDLAAKCPLTTDMELQENITSKKDSNNMTMTTKAVIYGVDERPPFLQSLLLGFQVRNKQRNRQYIHSKTPIHQSPTRHGAYIVTGQ